MTINKASEKYNIPIKILKEYERWGLCGEIKYDTVVDLAQVVQRENARPEIAGSIENISDYDVIYVGFPKMEYGFNCVSCI